MKSTGENEPTLQPQRSRRGLWIVIGVIAVVVIIVVSGAMTNWFGLGGPSPIQLNGAGSSFAFPLMSAWSTQYKALTGVPGVQINYQATGSGRSEEHTSELQSQSNLGCRLLLDNKQTD